MARTNVNRGKWSIICAVVLSAASLLPTAPASADDADDAFIAALQDHGINVPDRNAAIATAHSICDGFAKGDSRSHLVLSIVKGTNLSPHQAGYLIGASVASYCPQYGSQTAGS